MNELTQIIKTLRPSEIRLIRRYYNAKGYKSELKRLELFDLIKKEQVSDDETAAWLLYKKKPNSAYSHLKGRLKDDILKLLVIEGGERKYTTKYPKAAYDSLKSLLIGKLLLSRGAYKSAEKILKQASMLSEKYELAAEKILIDDELRLHKGFKEGIEEYEKYANNIAESQELLKHLLKAKDYNQRISVPNLFKRNSERAYEEYAEEAFKELANVYQKTKSPQIAYWYYYTANYYYQIARDFKNAEVFATKYLHLLQNEDTVFSNARLANANIQLAIILINLNRSGEAIEYALKADSFIRPHMINRFVTLSTCFHAYLRNHDFDEARKTCDIAFQHPRMKKNNYHFAKWHYFLAAVEFEQENHDASYELLNKTDGLAKDKTGWQVGCKLLEIMNLIEMNNLSFLDYRLDNFKKLLQRYKKQEMERIKLIVKILGLYVKNIYSMKTVLEKYPEEIRLLSEGKDQYYWDPTGYEIIRFDEWAKKEAGTK